MWNVGWGQSVSCNGGNVPNAPSKPPHFVPLHSSKASIPSCEFIPLHVVTKNLQSIRSEDRLADFCCELDNASFDFMLLTETWRSEKEDCFVTSNLHRAYLSGGEERRGVGIVVSGRFLPQLGKVSFHAYSPRICALHCWHAGREFKSFACYFPTAWDPDDAVDEVYELLSTLIDNCTRHGCVPVVGGDFNAQIGALQPSDDAACVGACGHGCRSARGIRFVHEVLMHGLVVLNRQLDDNLADDNWTCKRALHGALVQIDFVLSDSRMFVVNVWNDDMVAVGVDHRCVHCVLRFPGRHVRREARNKSLKSWVPFLDAAGEPSLYRNALDTHFALVDNPSCGEIENALLVAGNLGGKPSRRRIKFKPSCHLQSLRQQRRQTQLHEERNILTFQIQKLHRSEVRRWKTQVCSNLLRSTTNWAALKRVSQQGRAQTKGADVAVDDFAENLETLFHGDADQPVRPHTPTELPWSTLELRAALQKLRRNKSPDEHGLVAELLKYSTTDCHTVLLAAFNAILETGVVPGTWQKKLFSPCYQNSNALCNPQISSLLLFCGCFTRHLLI